MVAKQPFYSREFTSLRSRQQTEQLLPTEAAFERRKYQAGHTRINSHEEDKKKRITKGTLAMGLFGIHTGSDKKRAYGEKER